MKRAREQAVPEAEEIEEDESVHPLENYELEAIPEDFVACTVCTKALSSDERILNARFVNDGMAADKDISMYPICFKCNFSNLLFNNRGFRDKKFLPGFEVSDSPIFFPSNRKIEENFAVSQEAKPPVPYNQEQLVVEDCFEQ